MSAKNTLPRWSSTDERPDADSLAHDLVEAVVVKGGRITIAALSLSASALVALLAQEGYTESAVIPVKGDRATVGFGSTFRDDGTPVRMGDAITPPQAIKRSYAHIAKDEHGLKRCITAGLHQAEYDTLVDHSYQYGVASTCASSMVRHANAGRYRQSCEAYAEYRFLKEAKYDCSTLVNGKPNKRCWGVYQRSLERRDRCLSASGEAP